MYCSSPTSATRRMLPVLLLQEEAAAPSCSYGPFTWQLYQMLADAEKHGFQSIVSWQPHGRAFRVHDPEKFEQSVLPTYFKSSKYKSFSRQLNLYSFVRLSHSGPDQGAYFHRQFIKEDPQLYKYMTRQKGTKPRLFPGQEPNLYADATEQVLTTAISSPISSVGQDREISSKPLRIAKQVASALTMLASSSNNTAAAKSSVFATPFGAMKKVGRVVPRSVSADGSSNVDHDSAVSTNDSKIPNISLSMVYMSHLVPDEELHIPNKTAGASTPQQEVVRSSIIQKNEKCGVTEEDAVAITTTKGEWMISSFENCIQDYETVGDFEGRKFLFVAGCDSLENCMRATTRY